MKKLFAFVCSLLLGFVGVLKAQEELVSLIAHFDQPGEYTLGVTFSGTPGEKFLIQWWDKQDTISVENADEIKISRDIIQATSESIQYDVTIYAINPTGHVLSLSIDSAYKYTDLYLKKCPELTTVHVSHNNLSVFGLAGCRDLKFLDCSYNRLSSIDYLIKAENLTYLDLSHNPMDYLNLTTNLSNFLALQHLICNNTLMDAIELKLPVLEKLECSNNSLLNGLDLIDCPSLASVDFSENTQLKHLHISNTKLRALDLSVAPNLAALVCNENDSLTTLSIDNPKLEYLSLHNLPFLRYLSCRNTMLSNLSFSAYDNLPALKMVECTDNPLLERLELTDCLSLDSLDISNLPQLTHLHISNTKLGGTLDLAPYPNLEELRCNGNNSLTMLKADNPVLQVLECDHNRLETLLIDNAPALKDLRCNHNQLASLQLPSDVVLDYLRCDSNRFQLSVLANLVKQAAYTYSFFISPQLGPAVLLQVGQTLDLHEEMNEYPESRWVLWDSADHRDIVHVYIVAFNEGRFSFKKTGWYRIEMNHYGLFNHSGNVSYQAEVFYDVTVIDSVARPIFSEPSGAVRCHTPVSLSTTTPDARIYYTTDGSVPNSAALLYTTPIYIDEAVTIKAVAIQDTLTSRVATASYTIDLTANESDESAAHIRIYAKDRNIILSEPVGEVEVFTASGQCVYRGSATAIPVKRSGLYVVVAKGGRWKVAVR